MVCFPVRWGLPRGYSLERLVKDPRNELLDGMEVVSWVTEWTVTWQCTWVWVCGQIGGQLAPAASAYLLLLCQEVTDLLKGLLTQPLCLLTGLLQEDLLLLQLSVVLSQHAHFFLHLCPFPQKPAVEGA